MYGIFTYIYHTNQPNVGKYASFLWILRVMGPLQIQDCWIETFLDLFTGRSLDQQRRHGWNLVELGDGRKQSGLYGCFQK